MSEKDDWQFNKNDGSCMTNLENEKATSLKYVASDAEDRRLLNALDVASETSRTSACTIQKWPWTSSHKPPGQYQARELLSQKVVSLCEKGSTSDPKLGVCQDILEQVYQHRSSAADLLCFMSFFNHQGIHKSILEAYQRNRRGGKVSLDQDLEFLTGCSLVTTTEEDDVYGMHSVAQTFTQTWISSTPTDSWWKNWPRAPRSDEEAWRRRILHVISLEYPDPHDVRSQGICQRLDTHVNGIIEKEPRDRACFQKWGRLLQDAALYRCKTERNQEAEQLLQRLLEANERVLGLEDPSTLSSMQCLGTVLSRGGKYKEAEEVQRRCLEIRQRLSGPEHPTTLFAMNNLALTLTMQGRFEESNALCQSVLEAKREVSGFEYLWTLAGLTSVVGQLPGHRRAEEVERLQWSVIKRTGRRVWGINSSKDQE